jgi:hypothetical protein
MNIRGVQKKVSSYHQINYLQFKEDPYGMERIFFVRLHCVMCSVVSLYLIANIEHSTQNCNKKNLTYSKSSETFTQTSGCFISLKTHDIRTTPVRNLMITKQR